MNERVARKQSDAGVQIYDTQHTCHDTQSNKSIQAHTSQANACNIVTSFDEKQRTTLQVGRS